MTRTICLIPGDGIGHEVIPAATEVLRATGLAMTFTQAEAGWDAFQRHGVALPPATIDAVRQADATLFGAVSSPLSPVEGYRSPIVALRRELDLYANLRPVLSQPVPSSRAGIDMLIVRENSEGLYAGRERATESEAITERLITRAASLRIANVAFRLARGRRRRVTIVHKANVLRATCGLFRKTAFSVAEDYPDVQVDEMLVDAAAMHLITEPERFDVLVTTNLFGDILSDEAAALVGGLGLAPSGNIGDDHAIFEPVHGSAPDIAGTGRANPVAAILAAAMLLEHLGASDAAARVQAAVAQVLAHGPRTPDLGGTATTQDVTHAIITRLKEN